MAYNPIYGTGWEAGTLDILPPGTYGALGGSNINSITTDPVKTGTYAVQWAGSGILTSGRQWYRFPHTGGNQACVAQWIYPGNAAQWPFMDVVLEDGSTIGVRWTSSGTWVMEIDYGTVVSGTLVTAGYTWTHVQFTVTIDGTSGIFQTKIDGIDDIDYSGDTQPDTSTEIAYVRIGYNYVGNAGTAPATDDFTYGTGDLPGDVRFDVLYPTADNSVEWTPSTGSDNYALVDEIPPDTDDYVTTSGSAVATDKYDMSDWVGTAKTPIFIAQWMQAMKDTAGYGGVELYVESGGQESTSGSFNVATSWQYYQNIIMVDPDTSGSWTESAIDDVVYCVRTLQET